MKISPLTSGDLLLPWTPKLKNFGLQALATDVAETLSSVNNDIKLYQSNE